MTTKNVIRMKGLFAFALILAAIIMFAMLQSCTDKHESEEDENAIVISKNELEDTDKLVVYGYEYLKPLISQAVNLFKREYREVEVEYREFSFDEKFDFAAFQEVLKSEMLAGGGPDLIIGDAYLFGDIYKTMASGVFLDLDGIIEADPEFDFDLYNRTVMDSGVYNGRRYLAPLDYAVMPMMAVGERLAEEGIDISEFSTLSGFLGALRRYMANNMEKPGKHISYFPFFEGAMSYLNFSGIQYIDYENQKADFSDPKFKEIVDTYKEMVAYANNPAREFSSYYEEHISTTGGYSHDYAMIVGLRAGQMFYSNRMVARIIERFYYDYGGLTHDCSPVFAGFPNKDGGTTAVATKYAGVRQGSENKKNAYRLLKILLSYDVQALQAENAAIYYQINVPVLKSAAQAAAEFEWSKSGLYGNEDGSVIWEPVPKETHDRFMDIITNVDSCALPAYGPYDDFILPALELYFSGEKTYDACINDLKTKLEIYLSE
ncbi:MAG: ABC transporter substrate-binding protein [Oscillospiraceae bacterium]|nr:ABC transporter substrate-binding protein [Oscillospiraceae bacterium]